VIVEHEVAADRGNARGKSDPETPARDVHLMDRLIADVAVPGLPDPVPVVVKPIPAERPSPRRAGPEVVVDADRNGLRRRPADRIPPFEAHGPGEIDVADGAPPDVRDRVHEGTR